MQPADDEMLVCVQREWDGWQTAEVPLRELQNIHWFRPDRAPRPLLHGYVSCSSITGGMLPHNCDQTQGPHTLLVCVLKCHIAPSVYEEVTRRADQQHYPGGVSRFVGGPPLGGPREVGLPAPRITAGKPDATYG